MDVDLSNWNFQNDFDGEEAASLIAGIEPVNFRFFSVKTKPIYSRMKQDYEGLKDWYIENVQLAFKYSQGGEVDTTVQSAGIEKESFNWLEREKESQCNRRLESVRVTKIRSHCAALNRGMLGAIIKGMADKTRASFEAQRFTRSEIIRWLDVIGMKSTYQFDLSQANSTELRSSCWPWGNHHTESLGHLEAAALRYWVNYEPTDATTAPTNKDVSEWLIAERKVSQKMAESIASMLRPDGLATGPRK